MANITKGDVYYKANVLIRDKCNSGISWGTNSYPANSLVGWFGGTTAGKTTTPSIAGSEVNAANIVAGLTAFAAAFSSIRRTRIVIYRSMNGYNPARGNVNSWHAWTETLYDGTAIANLAYDTTGASPGSHVVTAGRVAVLGSVDAVCNNLYNDYVANSRNVTATLTNTVCHYSCHSNCHDSRGRR